jgi:hypothetical protein
MMNKYKQQIKLLPLQWTASLTGDVLLTNLNFFQLGNDIVHSSGVGRVAS